MEFGNNVPEFTPGLHSTGLDSLQQGMLPQLEPVIHGPLESNLHNGLIEGQGVPLEALPVQVEEGVPLMEGTYREVHSIVMDVGVPVTACHFDGQEENLWLGNQTGHVTSYFGLSMDRYSSFQAHATDDIRQIQSLQNGILVLTKNNLRCYSRGGLIMFDCLLAESCELRCMLLTQQNSLLIAGQQNFVVEWDLVTAQQSQKYEVDSSKINILRESSRCFFCGHANGKVSMHDLRSFKLEHEFEAHSGSLSDFDVHGNLLVTCGYAGRHNRMTCDPFLMVYDLRMMRAVTPLQVYVEPMFVRFIPTYTDRLAIISLAGQLQFCEPMGLASPADVLPLGVVGQAVVSVAVASSRQTLAFGDSGGCLHLWADGLQATFNTYSRETEFPLPCLTENLPHLDWNDDLAPLSLIPTPYTSEPLLSEWSPPSYAALRRKAPPVDLEILRTMKMVGFIGYAPNPRTKLRNQMPYKLAEGVSESECQLQEPESPIGREVEPHLHMVPKKYRKVTIKYSKLGLEDFDFKHYNKTMFAGLETHIPNAYCNSMIQVLYFIEGMRCSIQNHLCAKEFCLACELGFLFHMLDHSTGDPCQASNFLRAFRTIPEASALGLILADSDEATGKVSLGRLIQGWNRFILTQLHQEMQDTEDSSPEGESIIKQMFGSKVENSSTCRCNKETSRVSSNLLFTLNYPDTSKDDPSREYEFTEVLQRSICLEQNTQAWCESCEKYQPMVQTRRLQKSPDVLVVNCQVNSPKDIEFWKTQSEIAFKKVVNSEEEKIVHSTQSRHWRKSADGLELQKSLRERKFVWIPYSLQTSIDSDKQLHWEKCTADQGDANKEERVIYDLMASVAHVLDPRTGGNLTAHIRVPQTYHQRKEGVTHTQWYLFNDFLIEPIDKYEAVQFDPGWKIPCVLYFTRRDLQQHYDISIKTPIKENVLLAEASLTRKQRKRLVTFIPLSCAELPQSKDLIGLDAEFVTLNQEEAELRSDGTKSTIKPSQMSVARITCVRGQGPNKGIPFIDDYISTQEQVPKDQIFDTVLLFHIPRKRMISLRFLAWYFLELHIQAETHDSIEDSNAALQLYQKYLELSDNGCDHDGFRHTLKQLYEEGRKHDWKVPGIESG
uniref:PAN2-PAN3 deadenylation complex catalytic subunit PAN2 isoform X2 n=1 Tax=Myxine glutinosa TaxID=7769 RepID=UPI00358EBC1D